MGRTLIKFKDTTKKTINAYNKIMTQHFFNNLRKFNKVIHEFCVLMVFVSLFNTLLSSLKLINHATKRSVSELFSTFLWFLEIRFIIGM